MRRQRGILFGCALLGTALVAGVAWADPPCMADAKKLCSNVPIGGGRIQACLMQHEKELSDGCRKRVHDLEQEIGTLAAMCRGDIARFCSDVAPGGGRVLTCLKSHGDDLSPLCADGMKNPPGK